MKKFSLFKALVVIFLGLFFACRSYAQYDSVAIAILDSMSDRISDLETCSFRFVNEYDIESDEFGLITHSDAGIVYMKGPDKMYIEKKGDKGHKQFFFDGKSFSAYSFDRNQYATVPATLTLIQLIDSLSGYYKVDFPGADVFYPDFVDNILATSNNLVYLGLDEIGNVGCYHVAGAADDLTFQFWISDDKYLPVKMSLIYINKPEDPRYTILYSDWKLQENIDDSMFDFKVPTGAKLVKLVN